MVSVQPIQLWRYLTFRPTYVRAGVKRLFYLSWEDALWDILFKKHVQKGSCILVPEFFCGDVEQNMRGHGYKVAYYKTNSDLTSVPNDFTMKVKKLNPTVVVIFHPVGITSNLFTNTSWLKFLSDKTILIEDCVHRLINPKTIKFIKKNHLIMDSLRKVAPLQGSNVYGKANDLNFTEPRVNQSWVYAFKVTFLWLKMNILWNFGSSFDAEKTMITGYDLIGDSNLPARGWKIFKIFNLFINFDKITRIKTSQVEIYESNLAKLIPVKVPYSVSDKGKMRAWPIVFKNLTQANKILSLLRDNGLVFRFELLDSIWSKKYRVIYLPVGPHLKSTQIVKICDLVKGAL